MCFPAKPLGDCSSEDVFDVLIEDNERDEVEIQFQNTNRLVNGFTQIPLDEISLSLIKEVEESLVLIQQNYELGNAPVAYINELIRFNEINPDFSIDNVIRENITQVQNLNLEFEIQAILRQDT